MTAQKIPVIIGVGEIKNASRLKEDAIEPLHLMLSAIKRSAHDATNFRTAELIASLDSVSVVASSTWPYKDLPELLSENLGVKPSFKAYSDLKGSAPVQLIDDTARMIAKGDIEVGVVVGGEAMASLKTFIKTNSYPPPWTRPKTNDVYYANNVDMLSGIGEVHKVGVPMHVYAMYENARRAHKGQTPVSNLQESASLYGTYARIASKHPASWNFDKPPETAETIGRITKRNRMICFPYPLLMNAFNDVNIAGACILTSTDLAGRMGISRDKWIFPLGGGRGNDTEDFWNRSNYHSSPAIATALEECLSSSGLRKEDIDLFDFYSCFPIVPKLACDHLGIPYSNPPKPITLLGGLTSFGGAGANYSMHAVAEMVRRLRKLQGRHEPSHGLILANGGVLTTENAICLSTQPDKSHTPYPLEDKTPMQVVVSPISLGTVEEEAVVETYTVEYDRHNRPLIGHVVCRLKSNGARVIANHADATTLEQLASWTEEPIRRSGFLRPSLVKVEQNLFSFRRDNRL
ncbi:uncharacterized protein N7511_007754 [Penicillium nucicola]|uniref:uncharacterized protein n=1 Tax=Penicillium nucicola TaxID=1850975 RepID=UPI002545B109|nr:uncharacterized protein N7511_007754 [Penicillium nucicola]KAJ5753601.1 hypothetical protein N7511_007754 [Penicillium nucicola]